MFQHFSRVLSPSYESSSQSHGTIKAELFCEQLAMALQAVSAAQGEGDVGWIQLQFSGQGKIIVSAVSHNMSIRYEFLGEHEGEGVVSVSGRQLAEYVRHLPPAKVQVAAELPARLTLRCGGSKARLQLIQDQTSHDFTIPRIGSCLQVKGEALARWVDSFRDFVLVDDTRYYANGAYIWAEMDNQSKPVLNAVASDALRLAKARLSEEINLESNDGGAVLVPRRALDEIRRVATAESGRVFTLRWHQDDLFFAVESDNYALVTKCIAGNYPPYEAAIPQNISTHVVIDSKEFLESLRRALIFADKNKLLKLVFDGPVLNIQSFTPGQKEGEESLNLSTPVESSFEVNYNGTLLTGILSVLSGAKATFEWESFVRPVKVTGESERGIDVFYLLVPTRF